MSEEVNNFRDVILGFLQNIADDIARINTGGLSAEDKATLEAIAQRAAEVANIVPE